MAPIEIEAYKQAIRGEGIEEQRVMASVMDTKVLIEELSRREEGVNALIEYIKEFSNSIKTHDDLLDKVDKIAKIRKDLA